MRLGEKYAENGIYFIFFVNKKMPIIVKITKKTAIKKVY